MTFKFFISDCGLAKEIIHLKIENQSGQSLFSFKTPLRICKEDWDSKKQRPSNIYLKRYKKINAKLDALKIRLTECIEEDRSKGKLSSQRYLFKEIKNLCSKEKEVCPKDSLLYFINMYISSKKEYICQSTYKRYKVFFNLIERFEGFTARRLYVNTIDGDFIRRFISFGKEESYSDNTIYRTIHFVKTILNFAERKGIRTAVREFDIRRERQNRIVINLSENEVMKIVKMKVPEELQAAKDWLLISCYTGQRISDFMKFNSDLLKKVNDRVCISFIQQKTKKEILLPTHPVVLEIIRRYKNNFPQKLSAKKYNNHIKQIGRIAQLTEPVNAVKRIGHRVKKLIVEKWEVITSHIGRRSFATNFYGKIPTPLLMQATGHTTEQMFLKYINPVDESHIISLGNYFDKTYKESYFAGMAAS
ncbi:integrase [Chryseobacterium cucumeris]|uniref:phage integrase SAM-like domain-containing protein n=1 Tax=Chryseobacterium cucumeris TaxID=1813611 RepID=UPI0007868272|nr:phage integrase SAM-like domain-containing protein [Chryseobacterium cucumeris]KYH06630.1 integrase [Chryseobacterium cucumeris]